MFLLQEIGNLKKLQIFDASENKIEFLPDEISGCTALTDFHLSQNLLEELPDTIGKCELKSVTNDDPYFLVARGGRRRVGGEGGLVEKEG